MSHAVMFERVTKRFGSQIALNEVSFSVPRGCVFALLGENGAGKSTAIKSMLGLSEIDSGSILVAGRDPQQESLAIRRSVGYVAERPTLYEWMTVEEIGWFTAGFYSESFLSEYRTLAKRFQLPSAKRLKDLSKGARAKVALSLALADDPELLILDEPTSGLDTLVRREFLESMVDRAATGRTVLLSSHQIGEVERVADYVAILHEGRLVCVESLETLKSEFVEWTVTLSAADSPTPELEIPVLSDRRRGREWRFLARTSRQDPESFLQDRGEIIALDRRSPNLEEIFTAYLSEQTQPATI